MASSSPRFRPVSPSFASPLKRVTSASTTLGIGFILAACSGELGSGDTPGGDSEGSEPSGQQSSSSDVSADSTGRQGDTSDSNTSANDPTAPGTNQQANADDPSNATSGSGDPTSAADSTATTVRPTEDERFALGPTGVRRLTRAEAAATLADLFGPALDTSDVQLLPGDSGGGSSTPFDNDYRQQSASTALIEAIKAVAEGAATQFLENADLQAAVLPCSPSGPSDTECLTQFIEEFGQKALRRPLSDDQVNQLLSLQSYGEEASDFNVTASLVLRVLLQDLEFWYRIQIGTEMNDVADNAPTLVRLDGYETASRLSYLVTGSTPDAELLQSASADSLSTPDEVRTQAERLLQTDRAQDRIARFHAMWLGYESSNLPSSLSSRLRRESDALIKRVVFEEQGSWFDVLRSEETYIDQTLADHYELGLDVGPDPQWVSYGDVPRRGLLSHGTFLSAFSKFQDTSPTQRGILIRERLACQPIPAPPADLKVNVDQPPAATAGDCKQDRYAAHREDPGCAGCHMQTDPVGFGLEQYDNQGRFRTAERDKPECEISGDGELVGIGTFNGPAELAELMIDSGLLEECVARQYFRFAQGRYEQTDDETAITSMGDHFTSSGQKLDELVLDLVSLPAFGYRVVDTQAE